MFHTTRCKFYMLRQSTCCHCFSEITSHWVIFSTCVLKLTDISGHLGKDVSSDPSGGERHVAHIPVTVTSTLTSTKLIKTANKPWLLGHIKPNNADKVGSTSPIMCFSECEREGSSNRCSFCSDQRRLKCQSENWGYSTTVATNPSQLLDRHAATSQNRCTYSKKSRNFSSGDESVCLHVHVWVHMRYSIKSEQWTDLFGCCCHCNKLCRWNCLLLMHYISITFGLLGISTTILITVLRVFPGS